MRRTPRLIGKRLSWVVVLLAIVFSGALLGSEVTPRTADNSTSQLPTGAESARANRLQESLATEKYSPAIVVFDREGEPLTEADKQAVAQKVTQLGGLASKGEKVFPVFSDDGEAAFVGVPLATSIPEDDLSKPIADIRSVSSADLPRGLRANVTGGPAFIVDLSQVFDGANLRLLLTTAGVVALLLLITYRSPWLWLVPLAVVGTADQVASRIVAIGTHLLGFSTDGASTGITSVLVFGAGTNYALLLIARYREELRREENRYDAMRVALDRAAPAILASSGTVILALLCLGFADNPSSRAIGYGGAIGIAVAVAFALLVLPAAMTSFGRRLFWPFIPKVDQPEPTETGLWSKVAGVVTSRPRLVSMAGVLALVVLAIPLTGLQVGLTQTEQFRAAPQSVTGQEALARHFPAGASQPTSVITPADSAAEVRRAVAGVEGVQRVQRVGADDDHVEFNATLTANPASTQAFDDVEEIRTATHAVDDRVLVGGADAQSLDAKNAAIHDERLIIPLVLGVVLMVLLLLLRSVVAAVVLVLTVVATFGASLGASWWAFTHWFDFPALDLSVPLLSFLFLVALGVDYNIFLTTRAKEEAVAHDTRTAISTALAVTGGVITSAGLLLAAVFTVLGVLPLITLTQIGVIVGFGVLLDTLLVRTMLVPALVTVLGPRFWWPGELSGKHDEVSADPQYLVPPLSTQRG